MDPVPLTPEFADDAMRLAQQVFKNDDQEEIRLCFRAALDPDSEPEFMAAHECSDIRYWVVIENGMVAGVTGFYNEIHTPKTIWVSWFCVHPDHRNRGLGTDLLQFTIQRAVDEGYECLKLFTSDLDDEQSAHRLYARCGFVETHREPRSGYEAIFLRLDLQGGILLPMDDTRKALRHLLTEAPEDEPPAPSSKTVLCYPMGQRVAEPAEGVDWVGASWVLAEGEHAGLRVTITGSREDEMWGMVWDGALSDGGTITFCNEVMVYEMDPETRQPRTR